MYFSRNIKFLRKRKGLSQADVANAIGVPRPTYSGYENEISFPILEKLIKISDFFGYSIDVLIKEDLPSLSENELQNLKSYGDSYIKGVNIRVLHSIIDSENRENIELVEEKASAGYSKGYSDPEFIRTLPVFRLPFLSDDKKYRTFKISGDSMLPIPNGAYVTGEYIQNWYSLKDGDACIIVTNDDGIVFKCIKNKLKTEKKLILYSLNKLYEPYDIEVKEIKEIWKFVNYISSELPEPLADTDFFNKQIANLNEKVEQLVKKLGD